MSVSYQAKDALVQGAQLKVQRVVLPIKIVGNATAANVAITNKNQGFVGVATAANVSQIPAAILSTYTVAATDATGIFNVLVKINETISEIVSLQFSDKVAGSACIAKLGTATGITGKSIMVTVDSSTDFTGANTLDGALEIEYIVA